MPTILNIGQCDFDHDNISRLLLESLGVRVIPAAASAEALSLLRSTRFDLVLVNRILDGDGASGIELIRTLKMNGNLTPMMLVSNYPAAQKSAVEAGALPGFGKSQIGDSAIVEQIREALGAASGASNRPGENTLLNGGVHQHGERHP